MANVTNTIIHYNYCNGHYNNYDVYTNINILTYRYHIVECFTDGDTVLGVGQFEQLHEISISSNCQELIVSEGNVLC